MNGFKQAINRHIKIAIGRRQTQLTVINGISTHRKIIFHTARVWQIVTHACMAKNVNLTCADNLFNK